MENEINDKEMSKMIDKMIPSSMKETIKSRSSLINEIMNVCNGYSVFEIKTCMKMVEDRIDERVHYFHVEKYE